MASEAVVFAKSPIVTILVGPAKMPYRVHKDILVEGCKYFRAAYANSFAESLSHTFEFTDEEQGVMETFTLWLYSHRVVPGKCYSLDSESGNMADEPTAEGDRRYNEVFSSCVQIWVFSQKRGVPKLQNKALDLLHWLCSLYNKPHVWSDTLGWAWENTLMNSKLRDFLAMAYVVTWRASKPSAEDEDGTTVPKTFYELALYYSQHDEHGEELLEMPDWHKHWMDVDMTVFYA